MTSRFFTMTGKYDTGDVVVFHMIDVDGERDVIKRVIGKAGDSIEIKNGAVYRNGVLISEEYAKDATEGEVSLTVPKGGIFVLGDNREVSNDSRSYGFVPRSKILGVVKVPFWNNAHEYINSYGD